MLVVHKRLFCASKRNQIIKVAFLQLLFTSCFSKHFKHHMTTKTDNLTKPELTVRKFKHLEPTERFKRSKICEIPRLDPFTPEIMKFNTPSPNITCPGEDYIKCYQSKCRPVSEEIVNKSVDFYCIYRDIIYENDNKKHFGNATMVRGFGEYTLNVSDHVDIRCRTTDMVERKYNWWIGHGWGLRSIADKTLPEQLTVKQRGLNVLMIGFDSMSHNAFVRKMPKSYKYVKDILGATVLNGYNVVGDGTQAALIPLLTGRSQSDLPSDQVKSKGHVNQKVFIFHKLKSFGYRTAYFEDMRWVGTFTHNYPGFRTQPADHYSRSFYQEVEAHKHAGKAKFCVGDTPSYQLMMNISEQVLQMPGKNFVFTLIADISHDDINLVGAADDDFVEFLSGLKIKGYLDNTLLMVFGDHGPRYGTVQDTFTGIFEERLPLMAILLPTRLKKKRPRIQKALESNAKVLTTPLDIYATVLDALDLRRLWNNYKVPGVDKLRGLTLLERISPSRSCYEAGVDMHWCTCLNWVKVSVGDPKFKRAGQVVVDAINWYTEFKRLKCARRNLKAIAWVRQVSNPGFNISPTNIYKVKLSVGPGHGVYEATVNYNTKTDDFNVPIYQISRSNRYGDEPKCIVDKDPQLSRFCYCIN